MQKSFIQRIYPFAGIIVLFTLINFSAPIDSGPLLDISSSTYKDGIQSGNSMNFPLAWNLYYGNKGGLNNGTIGALYYKGKYYINTWSLTHPVCYTIKAPDLSTLPDLNDLDSIISPPYLGEIRDMTVAPDGSGNEYIWGGKAANTLYKMDSSMNVKSSYSINGGSFRGIAWDPNRKGFWNCNFAGNIVCHDTLGNIKGILNTGTSITAKYGIAWDSVSSADSAFLWVWNQPQKSSYNKLYKIHIATDSIVSIYTIELSANAVAGGAAVIKSGSNSYLLLNFQSTSLASFSLSNDSTNQCNLYYSNTGISKQILDHSTIYDTLNIQSFSRIPSYVRVVLDTIYHSWVGDLTLILSHNGITDTLMNRPGRAFGSFGSNGKNFFKTILSDDGIIPMDSINSFMQPYTSPPFYRPGTHYGMDSLSRFKNTELNGNWILSIKDNVSGDQGMLKSWGLCFGEYGLYTEQSINFPKEYELFQNYPNPFNPTTTIKYSIPKNSFVEIRVYDITGKEITLLENRNKPGGVYEITFNGTNLSSGVYFFSLKAGKYNAVKRMILLK
jgi:hypothetical protein